MRILVIGLAAASPEIATMKSIAGQLLVASRHLRDPNFFRTVVLIVQHDDEGALGLVLNRPGEKAIADIWERTGYEPCDNPQKLFVGGPVPGPLMAIHTHEDLAEIEIHEGLYFATSSDTLDYLVRQDAPTRLFTGHAGWGSGQLESEMEVGGWLTSPASADDIWSDPDALWKSVTSRIGMEIIAPNIAPECVPEDPNWN
jgi:putative transcriptional regulator